MEKNLTQLTPLVADKTKTLTEVMDNLPFNIEQIT